MPNLIADQVRAEAQAAAARRHTARVIGQAQPLDARAVVESIQSEMLSEPSDMVRLIRSQWPELWVRVVVEARRQGVSPAAQLILSIEAGLPDRADG